MKEEKRSKQMVKCDKKPKKKISVYLDWPHEFVSEMGKPSGLINRLLEKEFGGEYSKNPDENERLKIKKTLQARTIVLSK